MPISRSRAVVVLAVFALASLAIVLAARPSRASTPPSQSATAPALGQPPVTITWTGTISPQSTPTSDCNDAVSPDEHEIKLAVPSLPAGATVQATFQISWKTASTTSDQILTVDSGSDEVGSSDGSGNTETVTANGLKPGTYTALACGFVNAQPTDYTGRLTLTTVPPEPSVPSADAQGLQFSAGVPADNQRDEAEPLINIDDSGRMYTCGPTGFSNASDYAQVSTDGGDQFHLLGTPPRGQQGLGGGGDCGLATAPVKNADGFFQYSYAGLGSLTGFTTSTSPDGGRTIFNAGPQGNTNTARGGGADRQWLTYLDDHTVLLSYNQQQPRNIVVQRSTDGGLTYLPGADAIAGGNPNFPGPMRSMPASFVTPGAAGRVAYFGWNSSADGFDYVNFSISDATGLNWRDCNVAKIPSDQTGGLQAFTVADNDNAGNIYLAYGDEKGFHTYLTTLTADKLRNCDQLVSPNTALTTATPPSKNPGWSAPVQVDRDNVRTTIFPWLVARGDPGRVAVAFYGSETDGDPNPGSFKATWDVYVNQSLNALAPNATFSQVKVTTHPFHYDSICLRGLSCDLSVPPGDRSLADFFAIDYNPVSKRLSVVFDRGNKKPDEAAGHVAEPVVATQIAGPSNGGGAVATDTARTPVRSSSTDPAGDALVGFSNLVPSVAQLPIRTPAAKNEPAMDFLSQAIGFQTDPATGARVNLGGFDVTLKIADLSNAALQQALTDTRTTSLMWVFRFVNGYQAAAASARWNPQAGFSFGYNDYTTASAQCGSDADKCVIYPGDKPIKGRVDQAHGTITLSVPRSYLRGLIGPTGPGQRPTETKAVEGTRFYDATAFSLANTSPDPAAQSFLYPADNLPAMDFLLPGTSANGASLGPGQNGSLTAGACRAGNAFGKVSVRPRGRGVRLSFTRRVPHRAAIDIFQVSHGRSIIRERLIAHFARRTKGLTWNGRANRRGRHASDGFFFVRFSMRDRRGHLDVRRFTLLRSHGRYRLRPTFYRRDTCGTVRSYKLGRAVFGGRRNGSLEIAYRLSSLARVGVTVTRGRKVVKRFRPLLRRGGVTYRLHFGSKRMRRADYQVKISATRLGRTARATLVSRRI